MIVYQPNGDIFTKRHICGCHDCLVGNVNDCGFTEDDHEEENCDKDDDVAFHDDDIGFDGDAIFDVVKEGSTVALYTPSNIFEPFYLCKVIAKQKAVGNVIDTSGHSAMDGDEYFVCHYLRKREKCRFSKHGTQYELVSKKKVIVHPLQVLSPFVNLSDNMFLSNEEYQFLSDCC